MHKFFGLLTGCLLTANALFAFNRQDTLGGSNGRGRDWWDVQHYKLEFSIDPAARTISGSNTIQFTILDKERDSMQIDLQEPMVLDSAFLERDTKVTFMREGNVYWLDFTFAKDRPQENYNLTLYYHGKPREAVTPPWDGGFIWTKDSLGNPWISVACQGLGASSWWPCKDYQGDEPDSGMEIIPFQVGYNLISNGRLNAGRYDNYDAQFHWLIKNPINTYNATFYSGVYGFQYDTFLGKKEILNIYYFPLLYNETRAKENFKQVKKMLEAFEYWFGPYPFYEDGYKIVEAPFLGMEHQSAIAYGNNYQMGYRGKDRSGTGVGLLFDFIIVHESGHEWFGNSITAADIADNWIHEGFTTYSETLFAEYWWGKEKAFAYTRGEWKNISNDRPVIGNYGVSDAGSGDKYDKASALVHSIRLLMNDDDQFRAMLHKMNDTFYHKQITSKQMEEFIIGFSGLQLQPIFDQYLRTTMIPELQWRRKGKMLEYRLSNVVEGFELPIPIEVDKQKATLKANAHWQKMALTDRQSAIAFPPTFLHALKEIR
ncbi:MAG: M1 family metallopeptidase [Phycisphaerales bacterium]|nr:M1 family metallopeptidase [Phycisphaerales bacterium]